MQPSLFSRAVAAARSTVSSLGLTAYDSVVLHNSNKLTVRLLPCDIVARVATTAQQAAQLEVDLALKLVAAGCPIVALDPRVEPRVYERDAFAITFWTYHEPVTAPAMSPGDYADALRRLHRGMRTVDIPTPHFTDRVEEAEQLVASGERTPQLADDDRELLRDVLQARKREIGERNEEQLLHGEPHPGNVLNTTTGPLFIDLETCCRGPIEFDLAHAPEEVSEHYPDVDRGLLRDCQLLVLAMITTWRFDRTDELPHGRELATLWLDQIRAMLTDGRAREK